MHFHLLVLAGSTRHNFSLLLLLHYRQQYHQVHILSASRIAPKQSSSLPSTASPSLFLFCFQHRFNILNIPGIKPSEVAQPSTYLKPKPIIMSFIDPSLLSLSPASITAAPAQTPQRSQRRTRPIVIKDHTVLRPLVPRPQQGPHSGTKSGAAGLQDYRITKKPRKPRTKGAKTVRKSAVRKAQDVPLPTDSDGDSGSIVAINDGIRWRDGSMQWWDGQEDRWSMILSYVTALRYRH